MHIYLNSVKHIIKLYTGLINDCSRDVPLKGLPASNGVSCSS